MAAGRIDSRVKNNQEDVRGCWIHPGECEVTQLYPSDQGWRWEEKTTATPLIYQKHPETPVGPEAQDFAKSHTADCFPSVQTHEKVIS